MKKIFFAAAVSLVTVFCVSATVFNNSSSDETTSVSQSNAEIEYSISETINGSMPLARFTTIYNLLPADIQKAMRESYKSISAKKKSQFYYCGVLVKHYNDTWEFHHSGCSIIVRNASEEELDEIFEIM